MHIFNTSVERRALGRHAAFDILTLDTFSAVYTTRPAREVSINLQKRTRVLARGYLLPVKIRSPVWDGGCLRECASRWKTGKRD